MRSKSDLAELAVSHKHGARMKSASCLQTVKFNTNRGPSSVLFSTAKLLDQYLLDIKAGRALDPWYPHRDWAGKLH